MNKNELDKIIKANKKRTSVFDEYLEEIKYLRENKVTLKAIIEFLQKKEKDKKGLTTANLSRFLKRRKQLKNIENNTKKEKLKSVSMKDFPKAAQQQGQNYDPNKRRKITHHSDLKDAERLGLMEGMR